MTGEAGHERAGCHRRIDGVRRLPEIANEPMEQEGLRKGVGEAYPRAGTHKKKVRLTGTHIAGILEVRTHAREDLEPPHCDLVL